jgi:hypothetical protein
MNSASCSARNHSQVRQRGKRVLRSAQMCQSSDIFNQCFSKRSLRITIVEPPFCCAGFECVSRSRRCHSPETGLRRDETAARSNCIHVCLAFADRDVRYECACPATNALTRDEPQFTPECAHASSGGWERCRTKRACGGFRNRFRCRTGYNWSRNPRSTGPLDP